jgi:outer membrane protein
MGLIAIYAATAVLASQQTPTVPPGGVPIQSAAPPPTGPTRALPRPSNGIPDPFHPLTRSPKLEQVAPQHPITIDDAIAIALSNSPTLAEAGQSVEIYSGRVGEAESALGPNLGLTPGENLIHREIEESYGIAATLPIDISHLLTNATERARFQEIGARLDVDRLRNEIVYNVENAFYGVLRAEALTRVADEDLQNSLDRLHDSQVRYRAQAVAYIDVLRTQTDVANAQRQVIAARSGVDNAIADLNNAMGIDVSSPTSITSQGAVYEPPGVAPAIATGPDQPVEAPPPSAVPVIEDTAEAAKMADAAITQAAKLGPEFRAAVKEALTKRPEIYEAEASIKAAQKGILIAQRSLLPSLSVGVGYFDERSVTGTRYNEPQGFVGLTIPVFDSGLARSRVKEARATVSQAVTQERQQVDTVTLDVQHAYLAVAQAENQVEVANQALAEARGAFEIARVRYNVGVSGRAGISPQLEVSDAQAALTLAQQNQVNALYDYNSARAQLDRAIGRFAYLTPATAETPKSSS